MQGQELDLLVTTNSVHSMIQPNINRVKNRRESHKTGEETILDLLKRHTENI